MSCKSCSRRCRHKKPVKEMTREQKIRALRKQATLSHAIGVLWKRVAQDWDKQADELDK